MIEETKANTLVCPLMQMRDEKFPRCIGNLRARWRKDPTGQYEHPYFEPERGSCGLVNA